MAALNRLDQVRENGATSGAGLLADYSYDPLSRRSALARGNGTAVSFGYDLASRLSGLTQDFASTGQDLALALTYTAASQLQTRSSAQGLFDYSGPLVNRSYAANRLNQYSSVGGTAHTHDLKGNLTSDGSRTFTYDVENRLTSVSGSASLALTYDPLGRLRQSSASGTVAQQFLYEGDRLIGEYSGSGTLLRRYVHGPGVDEPLTWYEGSGLTDRRTLHADERGSIIASSNASGVATAYTYGPWGEPNAWAGPRLRYTGQIAFPEVQLYHYKARVYDPALGRFLQTDPVGYEDDVNWYVYVRNDPLNQADPTGTERFQSEFNRESLQLGVESRERHPDDWLGPAIGIALSTMFLFVPDPSDIAIGAALGRFATGLKASKGFPQARRHIESISDHLGATGGRAGRRTTEFEGRDGKAGASKLFDGLTRGQSAPRDGGRLGSLGDGSRVQMSTRTTKDGVKETSIRITKDRPGSRIKEVIKVRFREKPE